jgi:hypothetical protein
VKEETKEGAEVICSFVVIFTSNFTVKQNLPLFALFFEDVHNSRSYIGIGGRSKFSLLLAASNLDEHCVLDLSS